MAQLLATALSVGDKHLRKRCRPNRPITGRRPNVVADWGSGDAAMLLYEEPR